MAARRKGQAVSESNGNGSLIVPRGTLLILYALLGAAPLTNLGAKFLPDAPASKPLNENADFRELVVKMDEMAADVKEIGTSQKEQATVSAKSDTDIRQRLNDQSGAIAALIAEQTEHEDRLKSLEKRP